MKAKVRMHRRPRKRNLSWALIRKQLMTVHPGRPRRLLPRMLLHIAARSVMMASRTKAEGVKLGISREGG